MERLVYCYIQRKISAEDLCISMHNAATCGITEAIPYGRKPGLTGGKYSDHLKSVLGYRSDCASLYELVDTPCKKAWSEREVHDGLDGNSCARGLG